MSSIELVHGDDDDAPELVHVTVPETALAVMPGMSPEERRTYIGGSDAAKALNESRWGDSYSLAEEKLGVRPPDDLSTREDVYFGTILEAVVCQEYMRRTGRKVRRVPRLLRHPKYPWMGAHLDRIIINESGIIEAKTTKASKEVEWGEPGTDEVPREYFIQGQHNMAVSDRLFCDYPVLFGGQRLLIYTVKRDEAFIEAMIRLEYDRVWQYVERGELPPPETAEEANRRWPLSHEGEVQADEKAKMAVIELVRPQGRGQEGRGRSFGEGIAHQVGHRRQRGHPHGGDREAGDVEDADGKAPRPQGGRTAGRRGPRIQVHHRNVLQRISESRIAALETEVTEEGIVSELASTGSLFSPTPRCARTGRVWKLRTTGARLPLRRAESSATKSSSLEWRQSLVCRRWQSRTSMMSR